MLIPYFAEHVRLSTISAKSQRRYTVDRWSAAAGPHVGRAAVQPQMASARICFASICHSRCTAVPLSHANLGACRRRVRRSSGTTERETTFVDAARVSSYEVYRLLDKDAPAKIAGVLCRVSSEINVFLPGGCHAWMHPARTGEALLAYWRTCDRKSRQLNENLSSCQNQ